MLEDILRFFVNFFDKLLIHIGLTSLISNLISYTDDWQQYQSTFNNYLSGVYFIFGKPLVIYMVTLFAIIVSIRIIMAFVNIIGQYVP